MERTLKVASDGFMFWQWMYFSNNVLIKNCIVNYEHVVSNVR